MPTRTHFTEIVLRFYREIDESFLQQLIQDGELEYFMRTVPPELQLQHADAEQSDAAHV